MTFCFYKGMKNAVWLVNWAMDGPKWLYNTSRACGLSEVLRQLKCWAIVNFVIADMHHVSRHACVCRRLEGSM